MARVRTRAKPKPVAKEKVEKKEKPVEEKKTVLAADDEMRIIARYKARISNPLTAIRAFCVECMGGAPQSVSDCPSKTCSLWNVRMGKNMYDARVVKRLAEEADSE